jgi:hypothetical protein
MRINSDRSDLFNVIPLIPPERLIIPEEQPIPTDFFQQFDLPMGFDESTKIEQVISQLIPAAGAGEIKNDKEKFLLELIEQLLSALVNSSESEIQFVLDEVVQAKIGQENIILILGYAGKMALGLNKADVSNVIFSTIQSLINKNPALGTVNYKGKALETETLYTLINDSNAHSPIKSHIITLRTGLIATGAFMALSALAYALYNPSSNSGTVTPQGPIDQQPEIQTPDSENKPKPDLQDSIEQPKNQPSVSEEVEPQFPQPPIDEWSENHTSFLKDRDINAYYNNKNKAYHDQLTKERMPEVIREKNGPISVRSTTSINKQIMVGGVAMIAILGLAYNFWEINNQPYVGVKRRPSTK